MVRFAGPFEAAADLRRRPVVTKIYTYPEPTPGCGFKEIGPYFGLRSKRCRVRSKYSRLSRHTQSKILPGG